LAAFSLDGVIQISKNKGIYPSSGTFDLEFSHTRIPDFFFRGWYLLFCCLWSPVEDLLFAILVEGSLLSSVPGLVQPMLHGRSHTGSRTVEWFRQRTDGDW
jgi:hypothetical protein